MTDSLKQTTILEVVKMGAFAVIMLVVTYVLYEQNVRFQDGNTARMDRLEEQWNDCNDSKQNLMLDQIEKSNDLMRAVLVQMSGQNQTPKRIYTQNPRIQ